MGTQKRKKNIPLIIVGIILLVAITSLRSQIGSGLMVSIIQVCALIIVLRGFGLSWTRKERAIAKETATRNSVDTSDSTELIKVWRDITDGNKSWGWKPVATAIAHIDSIPSDVINVAEKTNGSGTNEFPGQINGYDGVLWIARENTPYEPDHMLVFSPVFNGITDKKWWENTPLMLCSDIESWLKIKDASEKMLIIDDDIKMTPLTDDKDFSILTALLKTKHYKDIK